MGGAPKSSSGEYVDRKGEVHKMPHPTGRVGESPSQEESGVTANLAATSSKSLSKEEPESRMQRYLDFDPKLTGTSVGALLAVILGDAAERLGTTLDPLVATAYAGLIIVVVTWAVPKRR